MHYFIASGAIFVALVFWIISVQRSLVGMTGNINNAMSQIGLQLSSQCELLTSLLDLTNWYAVEECRTILKTMKAGNLITKDSLPEDARKQERIISETKAKIIEAAEGCPDLMSDHSYIKAMEAVHQYENMVKTSMLIYNDSAAKLNHDIRMFPTSMIAGILGFSNRGCFESVESTKNEVFSDANFYRRGKEKL